MLADKPAASAAAAAAAAVDLRVLLLRPVHSVSLVLLAGRPRFPEVDSAAEFANAAWDVLVARGIVVEALLL